MAGLTSTSVDNLKKNWAGKEVGVDWNGNKGKVCVDIATDIHGFGGSKLRNAMKNDYKQESSTYMPIPLGTGAKQKPDPKNNSFYRANPWLQQFFINTGRYENLLPRKSETLNEN